MNTIAAPTYESKLHMGSCPCCRQDALNVNLYRRIDSNEAWRCVECVWSEYVDADLDNVKHVGD